MRWLRSAGGQVGTHTFVLDLVTSSDMMDQKTISKLSHVWPRYLRCASACRCYPAASPTARWATRSPRVSGNAQPEAKTTTAEDRSQTIVISALGHRTKIDITFICNHHKLTMSPCHRGRTTTVTHFHYLHNPLLLSCTAASHPLKTLLQYDNQGQSQPETDFRFHPLVGTMRVPPKPAQDVLGLDNGTPQRHRTGATPHSSREGFDKTSHV